MNPIPTPSAAGGGAIGIAAGAAAGAIAGDVSGTAVHARIRREMPRATSRTPRATQATLPPLREDLNLFPAAANHDGSPAWMIHDPVTNRFFRIGWLEFELLSRWHMRSPQAVLHAVRGQTPLRPEPEDLAQLVEFFRGHQLLRTASVDAVDGLRAMAERARVGKLSWLLHNYLFIRLPLLRPQHLLQRLLPWIGFLWTRGFLWVAFGAAVLGLLLVSREWDSFANTFNDHLSASGLLGYALALMVAKSLHELGHAMVATRHGVKVAHMGLAFLVMWPMLYTDTGESWKLADRRQRFAIAAAGVATEFALAAFATLAWSLAEDGSLRSALFFLATTSWVLTLMINASPFMRFDGYFLLSDALDLQNLHARSFALARTRLRNFVLGFGDPDPEAFDPPLRRFLIGFAFATWIYRLVVFLGIALAVYHYFFKLLGIFLFAVEIAWFVARPLVTEMREWIRERHRIRPARRMGLLAILLALIALLAWPWERSVRGEGWLHAEQQQLVYSPFPARIVHLHPPGRITAGTTLVELDSPDTRSRAAQSRIQADALALQLDQSVGRRDGIERRAVLAEQLGQQLAEFDAQQAELRRLTLRAPFDGELLDVDPDLRQNVWITANQPIAILVDPSRWVVDALIEQRALNRIVVGSPVEFYPRGELGAPRRGEVIAIDSARAQSVPHPMLAADHGGQVPVIKQSDGALAPRDAMYRVRVRLAPGDSAGFDRMALGSVLIQGERRSLLADAFTSVAGVLVRESGF